MVNSSCFIKAFKFSWFRIFLWYFDNEILYRFVRGASFYTALQFSGSSTFDMDFLRLNFLDAKLPARCFLGPAKWGCLPPPDSCLCWKKRFCCIQVGNVAGLHSQAASRSGFPLLAGPRKRSNLSLKASKKIRRRNIKNPHAVSESQFSERHAVDCLVPPYRSS